MLTVGDTIRAFVIAQSVVALSRCSVLEMRSPDGEKGPAARRRPKAGREAYSLYVERPDEGGNEADGPLSAAWAEGEGVVPGDRALAGVVGVGHHRDALDARRVAADDAPVVLVDVAALLDPPAGERRAA